MKSTGFIHIRQFHHAAGFENSVLNGLRSDRVGSRREALAAWASPGRRHRHPALALPQEPLNQPVLPPSTEYLPSSHLQKGEQS